MEYFRLLHLNREPFSNSPEPDFFYQSTQHVECLQKLELAIRLRRGLNVVIGDVGTGKTTLCRQLIRRLDGDEKIKPHLLLDPHFSRPVEFLITVASMLGCSGSDVSSATEWQLRESIKNYLFEQGVHNSNCIVLIIDEGQKIPDFCLEILREFLNYETNEYKLLQIVIFAQQEFTQNLERNPGFADRINMSWRLGPLGFKEASRMIKFRVEKASTGEAERSAGNLFSLPALIEIYRTTGGYPRKIVILCHQIILALIVQNKTRANWQLVHACVRRGYPERKVRKLSYAPALAVTGIAVIIIAFMLMPERPGNITGSDVKNSAPLPPPVQSASNTADLKKVTSPARIPVLNAGEIAPQKTIVNYPPLLGQLHVKKKGTVWAMVEDVYGECTIDLIRSVAGRNPQIKDLDYIYEGDIINLPAVPVAFKASREVKGYWIQVAERKKLDEAYSLLKDTGRSDVPRLQMVSYWNAEKGLCFSLLLKMRFQDEAAVRTAMEKLPGDISSDARVMSDWDDRKVLFSRLPT